MYKILQNIVKNQFNANAFRSNFFKKDDLISDIYLYLSDIDEELTEAQIIKLLKVKYHSYFEVYDIKNGKYTNFTLDFPFTFLRACLLLFYPP